MSEKPLRMSIQIISNARYNKYMVSVHIVPEQSDATFELTNDKKVDMYLDYLDGIDGTAPSEGTVYRTAAAVRVEPCGSCVQDITKPEVRIGVPDLDHPMLMRCNVCGASWPDPEMMLQAKKMQDQLEELAKRNEELQRRADVMIEEMLRTRESLHYRIAAFALAGALLFDRIVRIFFP